MNYEYSNQKVLGRLSSLIEDYPQSGIPLNTIVSSAILMELSSIILPLKPSEQVTYFINERKVLLQILNLFRYENKVYLYSSLATSNREFKASQYL